MFGRNRHGDLCLTAVKAPLTGLVKTRLEGGPPPGIGVEGAGRSMPNQADRSEEQKKKIADLIREIEEEAAAQRAATGKTVLGRAAVLKQHPHERPNRSKKSYAPLVHAASRKVRLALYEGYRAFVAAYREAAGKLRAGDRAAIFPAGCFPPALPFVGG